MSSVASPPASGSSRPSRDATATLVVVVVVVVAVIAGFVALWLLVGGSDSRAESAPSKSGCTSPPAAPAEPQQFAEPPSPSLAQDSMWRVTLTTNCGPIVLDLDGLVAPQTVASFLFLSDKGFFDDTPCHRLTTAGIFVLQCGDPTGQGTGGPGYGYGIENAPANGDFPAGTVAMARSQDPNSNGSQFFIVYADTTLPTDGGGYSIFGKVVSGLPIVKAVAAKGTASGGDGPPTQPISILSIAVEKL